MSANRDNSTPARDRATRIVEAATALGLLLGALVCVFAAAVFIIRLAAVPGLQGPFAVALAAAIALIAIILAILSGAFANTGRRPAPRSGWLTRLDQEQPSDAEIIAAAEAAIEHFGGDAGKAAVWTRAEAIRFLEAGDLRRNLIAVRLKRAVLAAARR